MSELSVAGGQRGSIVSVVAGLATGLVFFGSRVAYRCNKVASTSKVLERVNLVGNRSKLRITRLPIRLATEKQKLGKDLGVVPSKCEVVRLLPNARRSHQIDF